MLKLRLFGIVKYHIYFHSIMADPWIAILSVIGVGGVTGALLTAFANYTIKEREYYIDVSKNKIAAISKLKHYVIQLSRYYNLLAKLLSPRLTEIELQCCLIPRFELDYPICLYFVCKILTIENNILEKIGALQFDDLEAEEIMGEFKSKVLGTVLRPFDDVETHKLTDILGTNDGSLPYPEFHEKYVQSDGNDHLYRKFESWFKNEEFEKDWLKELVRDSRARAQLLALELNQIYEMWYKSGPTLKNFKNFQNLSPEVGEYLKHCYPSYFCRISEFDLKWYEKIHRRISSPECYRYYLTSNRKSKKKREC